MTRNPSPKSVEELTYEEALAELENIIATLEAEQNPLEETMRLFERGQALVLRCNALLEAAEMKVRQLSGETLLPFEEETS